MSAIYFDCLVLPSDVDSLANAFTAQLQEFEKAGRISGVTVSHQPAPVEKQLVEQWEEQNPDEPLGERAVERYELEFTKESGSLNALAMDLSKLLTPEAELPADPVLREFEELFEEVATYPWMVRIRP